MIRESLAANSRNAFMFVTPGGVRGVPAPQQHRRHDDADRRRHGSRRRSGFASSGRGISSRAISRRTARRGRTTGTRDDQHDGVRVRRDGRDEPRRLDAGDGDVHERSDVGRARSRRPTLPAPWTSTDIGSPARAGRRRRLAARSPLAAVAATSGDTSDQFQFVYQPLQGDVEVIARVASLQYADPWSKAGVMIRETLTGGSRHAFMMVARGGKDGYFQRRIATGGASYRLRRRPKWRGSGLGAPRPRGQSLQRLSLDRRHYVDARRRPTRSRWRRRSTSVWRSRATTRPRPQPRRSPTSRLVRRPPAATSRRRCR